MGERRMSGWFVLSAVFIVLVFGLFFTFTERKSWPEHRIELGPMDMRLAPPISTLWCEAMALHSDHPFVAYQVNYATRISSKRLNRQKVKLQVKLGSSWSMNSMKLKYFLLPSSVMEIVACSSSQGVKLLVFQGDLDVHSCLQSLAFSETSKSSRYDSDEDSTEETDYETDSMIEAGSFQKFCSTLLKHHTVDVSYMDDFTTNCGPDTEMSPIKVNVTHADSYVIVAWNKNWRSTNIVDLQVLLDRTRYTVHRSGQPFDLCSLSTSCTIGLGFATGDRVIVSIPEEPNAGRSNFVVRTRCKPRLAVFAILSVFLPLLLFLAVTFVVRTDRDTINKFCSRRQSISRRQSNRQRIVAPLLDDRNAVNCETRQERTEFDRISMPNDEMPPSYHSLYDQPPPYACLKEGEVKTSQAG